FDAATDAPSPDTEAAVIPPDTVVRMLPDASSRTPPRATTLSVGTAVVKPKTSPPTLPAAVPVAETEMLRPSAAVSDTTPAVPLAVKPPTRLLTAASNL